MKMRFRMEGNELIMRVDGEKFTSCFDVCSILCKEEAVIYLPDKPDRKYKIGDEVFNGYVGLVAEVGLIPNIELNDMVGWAGKPGYGIRFYEIDPDTNLRTDELCKICWFPVEKVDSWDPLPPYVCVRRTDGNKYFICNNKDGTPHAYSGWSRLAAFREALGRDPATKLELMENTTMLEFDGVARQFKIITVDEVFWPFPKESA